MFGGLLTGGIKRESDFEAKPDVQITIDSSYRKFELFSGLAQLLPIPNPISLTLVNNPF